MSHFTVLVIGENPEQQLQPFHEFECTGVNDQYVQNVDKTEEARKEYESAITKLVQFPDGREVSRYDKQFYTKKGTGILDRDEFELPDGCMLVDRPTKNVEPFSKFAADYYGTKILSLHDTPDIENENKYGWVSIDARGNVVQVIDRTNPNKKWDWYQLGGRWTGFLKLKEGCGGLRGEPGLMTKRAPADGTDQTFKKNVDFTGMRKKAAFDALLEYRKAAYATEGLEHPILYPALVERYNNDYDKARAHYWAQPFVVALKGAFPDSWELDVASFLVTEDVFVERARQAACRPFAVLMNGEWRERGSMGWWGCVSDEKDDDTWSREFNTMLDALPGDTLLSVYDCHI